MWREELLLFLGGFPHPAWGPAPSRRVYELFLHLTGQRGRPVDEDSLFDRRKTLGKLSGEMV